MKTYTKMRANASTTTKTMVKAKVEDFICMKKQTKTTGTQSNITHEKHIHTHTHTNEYVCVEVIENKIGT